MDQMMKGFKANFFFDQITFTGKGNAHIENKNGDKKKTSARGRGSFFKVVPPGIEPGTQGFSVLCSTN
jgi:hypothetical protein